MLTEVWEDIPNYEGFYQVSDVGRVRSMDRVITDRDGIMRKYKGRVLKPSIIHSGYEQVRLCNDGGCNAKKVHRLVLETFEPHVNMGDLDVNHIDGNKLNNRLTNLEWLTRRDNVLHAYDIGLLNSVGERNPSAKLSKVDILEILERLDTGELQKNIASDYGVGLATISNINTGYTWKSVGEEYERAKKTIPR